MHEMRRFQLITKDSEHEKKFEALVESKNLSREDLSLILDSIQITFDICNSNKYQSKRERDISKEVISEAILRTFFKNSVSATAAKDILKLASKKVSANKKNLDGVYLNQSPLYQTKKVEEATTTSNQPNIESIFSKNNERAQEAKYGLIKQCRGIWSESALVHFDFAAEIVEMLLNKKMSASDVNGILRRTKEIMDNVKY